ncbi:uncharacterized protein LOC144055341 [Vanacampus margaritifer]
MSCNQNFTNHSVTVIKRSVSESTTSPPRGQNLTSSPCSRCADNVVCLNGLAVRNPVCDSRLPRSPRNGRHTSSNFHDGLGEQVWGRLDLRNKMAARVAKVTRTLSKLTSNDFQQLCKQLVSQASLKEGTCTTAEDLMTVLTSSLGRDEACEVINTSLEKIGYLEEKQSSDMIGDLLPQERPAFKSEFMAQGVLSRLMENLEFDHILSPGQQSMIISSNPDIRSMVFHLNHLVRLKGPDASKRMLFYLWHIEPRLYGHCFVDHYRSRLSYLVENVDDIINDLNVRGVVISDDIKAIESPRQKMSNVIDLLKSVEQKRLLYSILMEREPQTLKLIILETQRQNKPSWMDGGKSQHFEMATAKFLTETAAVAQDGWTKREPDVIQDGSYTWYSFLPGPGKFECSVSGLRWICKDSSLSFKYRFGRWWEHNKGTMESLHYTPAGPLLELTVTAGQFDEVYLPHWVCTTADPRILETFAVLHSDGDGASVEKVSEVTPSHVKLAHPVFSATGVMIRILRRAGFPLSLNCKVLVYKTGKTFLTLHVYPILSNPSVVAQLEKAAKEKGYERIEKSDLQGILQMDDQFIVTSNAADASICPENLKLADEDWDPNYFEVYIEQPGDEFTLQLENSAGTVWSCKIRKGDDSGAGPILPELETYDTELCIVRSNFVEGVTEEVINQLLDDLLDGILNDGEKDDIMEKNETNGNRARQLIDTIRSKGPEACRRMIFHLERRDRPLHRRLGLPSVSCLEEATVPGGPSKSSKN